MDKSTIRNLTLEQTQKLMDENGGNLNLSYTQIQALPEGLTVGGSLCLINTQIQALPEGLTVGGSLCLINTQIQALPEGLTVGGSLYLDNTQIQALPEGLTVRGVLDLRNTPIQTLPEGLTVGGSLYLDNTQIQALPEGLTVGGDLDLRNTPIQTLPERLTVGGDLDLSYTQIERLPKTLKIGDRLIMRDSQIENRKADSSRVKRLRDGDYEEGKYIYCDGILTHIKAIKRIDGYTLYIGKIPGRNVVSNGTHYAHCDNLRNGIADLLFKAAKDRGADQYKGVNPDTAMTVDELVTMYRVITGACRQGSERFVKSLGELKEKYTIREAIRLTEGQYGAKAFAEFFAA